MSPTRRITATRHGSAETRIRRALKDALHEIAIDARPDAREAMLGANLNERVAAYGREVDALLDDLAGVVVSQARPLIAERNRIHELANAHLKERIASAPRVAGTFRGPVPA